MAEYVNNHIHTTYSFSPYSPAEAVKTARAAGLLTAGVMDHDTVAGAREFIEAGAAEGIATTVGLECRCSMAGTPFEGRRLNNPDQKSVAYLTMHGIPHGLLDRAQAFITPYRARRDVRNRKMTERLDALFSPYGVRLGFDRDVAPSSMSARGGTITERHILFALAKKLTAKFGSGAELIDFFAGSFNLGVTGGMREKLLAHGAPFYEYHLLGFLKSSFMGQFFIEAGDELPHVTDFLRFAEEIGAISAYAYLGDVKGSATGDKRDDAFEDAYLDELVAWLAASGFRALTFMPSRNTDAQLDRIMALCARHGLFQVSGEDINSPFQSFICGALSQPRFSHLITATWALIGHEKAATANPESGMFTDGSISKIGSLSERIEYFARIGQKKQ